MATLVQIMDAIKTQLIASNVVSRVDAFPSGTVNPPQGVVAYPRVEFDATFGRGADTFLFPVHIVAGRTTEESARAALSAIVDGASGVKQTLDGTLGGVVDTARVTTLQIVTLDVNGIGYLSAMFELEVVT